jgi:hypothetical protein
VSFRDEDFIVTGKMSRYWPPLGGPNCSKFNYTTNTCESMTSSGEDWKLWEGCSTACPAGYEWTLWELPGGELFLCIDRGGKIVTTGTGAQWLDLLLKDGPPVPYGTEIPVKLRFPHGPPAE